MPLEERLAYYKKEYQEESRTPNAEAKLQPKQKTPRKSSDGGVKQAPKAQKPNALPNAEKPLPPKAKKGFLSWLFRRKKDK